jgi:hypothetical protein
MGQVQYWVLIRRTIVRDLGILSSFIIVGTGLGLERKVGSPGLQLCVQLILSDGDECTYR